MQPIPESDRDVVTQTVTFRTFPELPLRPITTHCEKAKTPSRECLGDMHRSKNKRRYLARKKTLFAQLIFPLKRSGKNGTAKRGEGRRYKICINSVSFYPRRSSAETTSGCSRQPPFAWKEKLFSQSLPAPIFPRGKKASINLQTPG